MLKKNRLVFLLAAVMLTGCSEPLSVVPSSPAVISIPDTTVTQLPGTEGVSTSVSESQPVESPSVESLPTESQPVESLPIEPQPTESQPVEPQPTEPQPTEPSTQQTQPVTMPPETLAPVTTDYTGVFAEIAAQKTLPVVYMVTNDGQPIVSKDVYSPATVTVFNCAANYELSATANVRVRGNSTASMEGNPPYRIKFDTKQGMLGLHGGKQYKNWVLLRTWGTLIPDYTAFKLASGIFGGLYYASDATFVNVYINNAFMGVYLLAEQNQVNDGRIEVNEPKENDANLLTGYCLELDNYPSDDHPHFLYDYCGVTVTDIAGVTRKLKKNYYTVKSAINTPEQFGFIQNYLNGCFVIVYQAAVENQAFRFDETWNIVPAPELTPQEAVCRVIDVNSVANMLILEELTHDYDIGNGSFYMSVDFSGGSRYTKLTFDAPWDFNWAYNGSTEGYYASTFQLNPYGADNSLNWFVVMMKMDWFRQVVANKWIAMSQAQTLQTVVAGIRTQLPIWGNDAPSAGAAARILDYVDGRINWLNSVWGQ